MIAKFREQAISNGAQMILNRVLVVVVKNEPARARCWPLHHHSCSARDKEEHNAVKSGIYWQGKSHTSWRGQLLRVFEIQIIFRSRGEKDGKHFLPCFQRGHSDRVLPRPR